MRACCSLVCHSMEYSGKPGRRAGALTLLHHLQHGVGRLWGRAGGEEEIGSRWGCVCVWDGMNGCCPQPAVQGRMLLLLPVQMLLQYSRNCPCMPALFTQVIDGPKPTTGSCGFDGESVHLVQAQWPSPSRCTCIPGYTDPIFTRDMATSNSWPAPYARSTRSSSPGAPRRFPCLPRCLPEAQVKVAARSGVSHPLSAHKNYAASAQCTCPENFRG
jgi:hypothetical protein